MLLTQLETAAPQSIEKDFVSTDSNTEPRMKVCSAHKVEFLLPLKVVRQWRIMFQSTFANLEGVELYYLAEIVRQPETDKLE